MKSSTFRHTLSFVIVAACLSVIPSVAFSQQAVVTDRDTGLSVSLENVAGKTIVTNLATGEALIADGELAGVMTDDDYAEMLRLEEEVSLHRRGEPGAILGDQKSTYHSGSFSVNGGTGGYESPLIYIAGTTVNVNIDGTCSRPGGDYVYVTLYRSISWWFDQSYGTKSYFVDGDGNSSTRSWSGVPGGKYYYIVIDKDYNGYWAYGDYAVWD